MPLTITQIRELITTKLANASDITASEHREVENAIVDYLEEITAATGVVKSKKIILNAFSLDRNYSLNTELPTGSVIMGVYAMMVCRSPNNGFGTGDTVTAPTPYPSDSGRTAAQGIGVQFNNADIDVVYIMVNDQLTIMTPYNPASGAVANNVVLTGTAVSNWSIQLIITYV